MDTALRHDPLIDLRANLSALRADVKTLTDPIFAVDHFVGSADQLLGEPERARKSLKTLRKILVAVEDITGIARDFPEVGSVAAAVDDVLITLVKDPDTLKEIDKVLEDIDDELKPLRKELKKLKGPLDKACKAFTLLEATIYALQTAVQDLIDEGPKAPSQACKCAQGMNDILHPALDGFNTLQKDYGKLLATISGVFSALASAFDSVTSAADGLNDVTREIGKVTRSEAYHRFETFVRTLKGKLELVIKAAWRALGSLGHKIEGGLKSLESQARGFVKRAEDEAMKTVEQEFKNELEKIPDFDGFKKAVAKIEDEIKKTRQDIENAAAGECGKVFGLRG